MARSNQNSDYEKVITPITNCRWFQSALYAKPNAENFNTKVFYFTEPERDSFPTDESYEVAKGIFDSNQTDFAAAKEAGLKAVEVFNKDGKLSGYEYEVDLSQTLKNGNIVQSVSGRLLNFYPLKDTLNTGDVKHKWIADLFDFDTNEKYTVTLSIAVLGRKLIDAICNLTPEQLQNNIELSFVRYEYKGSWRIKTELKVLTDTAEFGREAVANVFEISTWDEKAGKKGAYKSTPTGSKADNKEFLAALKSKLAKDRDADSLFVAFYNRIAGTFQETILKPTVTAMFEGMGWSMEIEEEIKSKTVKDGRNSVTIEEKSREVIYLTSNERGVTASADAESPEPAVADDMPF